jgi:hypothetical protein
VERKTALPRVAQHATAEPAVRLGSPMMDAVLQWQTRIGGPTPLDRTARNV